MRFTTAQMNKTGGLVSCRAVHAHACTRNSRELNLSFTQAQPLTQHVDLQFTMPGKRTRAMNCYVPELKKFKLFWVVPLQTFSDDSENKIFSFKLKFLDAAVEKLTAQVFVSMSANADFRHLGVMKTMSGELEVFFYEMIRGSLPWLPGEAPCLIEIVSPPEQPLKKLKLSHT